MWVYSFSVLGEYLLPEKFEKMWGTKSTGRLTESLDRAIKSAEPRFKPKNEAAKRILAEAAAVADRKMKEK
jgi:hypothetical protein